MTKTMIRLLAAATMCALPAVANAAVTYEVQNGKLTAIRGINGSPWQSRGEGGFNDPVPYMSGGALYYQMTDVEFIDGACKDVFTSCSTFTSFLGRARRLPPFIQTFLVDGVSIDGKTFNFDSDPASINGCSDVTLCKIIAGNELPGSDITAAVVINNYASGSNSVEGIDSSGDFETVSRDNRTFARITTYGRAASISAVPEPSTWAMMLAGFGLSGAAMRRRRRTATARVLA